MLAPIPFQPSVYSSNGQMLRPATMQGIACAKGLPASFGRYFPASGISMSKGLPILVNLLRVLDDRGVLWLWLPRLYPGLHAAAWTVEGHQVAREFGGRVHVTARALH